VKSRERGNELTRYHLKQRSDVLASGRAIGQKIGQGKVRVVRSASHMEHVQAGDVLVTDMTDPDWEPVMKRAAAIVTNRGGRTCHAAIIARELGIPAVVGCGNATERLHDGAEVTVSCAEGDTGHVYAGLLPVDKVDIALDRMPPIPTHLMMNVGNPELAFEFRRLPNEGVGLARLEFIIAKNVGIHPKALLELDRQPADLKAEIAARTAAYASPTEFYVSKIVEGVATIAAAFFPK
jgi:pyruvate,water dikinase